MFAIEKGTILKRDLVSILEQETEFLSAKDIANKLSYGSYGLILYTANELQEEIREIYHEQCVDLEIGHSGIKLHVDSSNLQSLYQHLFESDLSYEILKLLFDYRKFNTLDFCEEQGISTSSLRRKIKELNKIFEINRVHIFCSNQTSITGPETRIRILFYLFLWSSNRRLSNVSWITDVNHYHQLSHQIGEFIGISLSTIHIELLSFWVFISARSIATKNRISFTKFEEEILSNFVFPTKPDFLPWWNNEDWQFLLLTIYDSELYNFELPFVAEARNKDNLEVKIINAWTTVFESSFRPLTEKEKKFVFENIFKQFAANTLFIIEDEYINDLSHIMASYEEYEALYPSYTKRFNQFWDTLIAQFVEEAPPITKINSLLLANYLCPINDWIEPISIYFFSEFSSLYEVFAKDRLKNYFSRQYSLNFVSNFRDASLIIGTAPYYREALKDNQHYLVINPKLQLDDFKNIEGKLNGISNHT